MAGPDESNTYRELQPRSARLLSAASIASSHPFMRQSYSTIRHAGQKVTIGPGRDGAFTWKTGFLSAFQLPNSLPASFTPWEETLHRLPFLLRQGKARKVIHSLPPLTHEMHALPSQFLTRASIVISTLLHGYAFEVRHRGDGKTLNSLPPDLVAAWRMISSRLNRPIMNRSAGDDILNNLQVSGSSAYLRIEYFKFPEEYLSAGTQGEMEHAFAPVLEFMTNVQKYIGFDDERGITQELCNITSSIIDCARVFLSTRCQNTKDGLDFVAWGKTYPEIGRPLYPEGLNNSGVNSPLFHALDTFIGIEDVNHEIYEQQIRRRILLPPPIKLFLEALGDRRYSIRSYANKCKGSTAATAFDVLIQTYIWLLELHRMRAVGGITIAEASGRQQTAGGMHSGGQVTLDAIINGQLTKSISSRIGTQRQTLPATIISVSQSGTKASVVTLAYDLPLPARAGDRIQIWPETQDSSASQEPRHYSVADIKTRGLASQVSLTVAQSGGLCAEFLRNCVPGQRIQTRLTPAPNFWSPENSEAPMLLVAQGVGLGPFLGFLRQRGNAQKEGRRTGDVIMIISAKYCEDIPYFAEIVGLTRALPLTVYCALPQSNARVVRHGTEQQYNRPAKAHDIIRNLHEKIRSDVFEKQGHMYICGSMSFGTTMRSMLQAQRLVDLDRYHEDCFGGRTLTRTPAATISMAELARHNKPHDLWLAIGNVVFDVTTFASTHPGGVKTLMESAGMPADRKFAQVHSGDGSQGIAAQLEQYAIGALKPDSPLSSDRIQILHSVVQMQNVLANNTYFAPGRIMPFYVFADSLLVTWGSIWSLSSAVKGDQRASLIMQHLNDTLRSFKEESWQFLSQDFGPGLEKKELRLRAAYAPIWDHFDSVFDQAKTCCVQGDIDDTRFAELFDTILHDCILKTQRSVQGGIESFEPANVWVQLEDRCKDFQTQLSLLYPNSKWFSVHDELAVVALLVVMIVLPCIYQFRHVLTP
ncbi:Cytochrome b5-like Heme/Steroid binding domain-containing protein [Penicillium alfredii]|uniref:Indoleamine 2,3-dioxygenase n=1 Tax=Penicillium alfredii TaxID=1506179 RepID=A0A9W9FSX9_9EURO|nr:Cytochrome b5-like Heme/Steroid binding domain-containing protein [Penicillium alfredii]KAJ5105861.1 Cytochrome b5-like Heme/Steroid binding domain-containing protein [Penicillium alfredii]